jgi:hypothetical protein
MGSLILQKIEEQLDVINVTLKLMNVNILFQIRQLDHHVFRIIKIENNIEYELQLLYDKKDYVELRHFKSGKYDISEHILFFYSIEIELLGNVVLAKLTNDVVKNLDKILKTLLINEVGVII